MGRKELTAKQRLFIEEYQVDLNGLQAALRAGYAKGSAKHVYTVNMKNPMVVRALEEAMRARSDSVRVDVEWVLRNLIEVAGRCMQKEPVAGSEAREGGRRRGAEADGAGLWRFDSKGANRALELIGKHLGMFKEKVEVSGPDGEAIAVELGLAKERLASRIARLAIQGGAGSVDHEPDGRAGDGV